MTNTIHVGSEAERAGRLIAQAADFAKHAHGGQRRKYTGEPYWHHLRNVAARVAQQTSDPEVIAAAWLHDTIEDTVHTYTSLWLEFGMRVATLVLELTDVFTPENYPALNRAARKAYEARRLQDVSAEARLIKRADIEDNTRDIETNDPGFARVYLKEKRLMLLHLDIADERVRQCG